MNSGAILLMIFSTLLRPGRISSCYCARIANIAIDGMDAGERLPGGIEFPLIATGDDDCVTALVKLFRQLGADAARSTGNQNSSMQQLRGRVPDSHMAQKRVEVDPALPGHRFLPIEEHTPTEPSVVPRWVLPF
jgi:hypothetical protein